MKKLLFTIAIILGIQAVTQAQLELKPNFYAVFFKDKFGTKASLDSPESFLSDQAIKRRMLYNIPIDSTDLPVSEVYLDSLRKYGFEIWETSKWLNGAVIKINSKKQLKLLKKLVKKWDFLLGDYSHLIVKKDTTKPADSLQLSLLGLDSLSGDTTVAKVFKYNLSEVQNEMLNVPVLHSLGFTGRGVKIALLDAGFFKVNKLKAFKKLRDKRLDNGEIISWYDQVDQDSNVFDVGSHGMKVLSSIAAFSPIMVGTAPEATFYLFRSEDENSEYKIEEFNWVCAAEKADSIGVDIISSSLGYSDFDNDSMDYTYEDMNGNTAISTIGADFAAKKGIIVIISAGNEGDNEWKYITAPADADSVITVGAVGYNLRPTYFTSQGPTADGRLKPDVSALGLFVALISPSGKITYNSGTSFSAPLIAGLVACLKQAVPQATNMQILQALKLSASNREAPDNLVGYGVPNGYLAYKILLRLTKKSASPQSAFSANIKE